jgi:hypothetical protein
MWDEAVECYTALQLPGRAEKIVLERLKLSETPQMWCALGDLQQDPAHYERAWRLSSGRLARAKTALGRYYFSKVIMFKSYTCYTTLNTFALQLYTVIVSVQSKTVVL